MMIYIVCLAIIQALTEFLPVSSSAHIILMSKLMGFNLTNNNNDIITIALHIGSLLAVMFFYRREIVNLISFKNIKLLKKIIIAFAPIAVIGGLITIFKYKIPKFNSLISLMLIIFGIILYIVDRHQKRTKSVDEIGIYHALIIGIFQLFALIPGVSRSGITITAGRLVGLSRKQSIKFSLLLLIPTIGAAAIVLLYKIYQNPLDQINQSFASGAILAIILSTIFSYFVLKIFVKLSDKFTFTPFVIYRILIGLVILITCI